MTFRLFDIEAHAGALLRRLAQPIGLALAGALLGVMFVGCGRPGPFAIDERVGYGYGQPPRTALRVEHDEWEERAEPDELATEGPIELSVEQAVMTALRYNRALQAQQLEPIIVGQFEQLERAVYDPVLDLGGTYSRGTRRLTSSATRTTFDVENEDLSLRGGLTQRLPTGTDVGVDITHDQTTSNRTSDQHSARVGLTVTQALLQGFGIDANLASIRQARLDTLISEYELRGFAESLVATVEQTYWDVVLARREIEIFESSLDVAMQQQREAERRVEVGVLAETELAASSAEVALRREALINARAEYETQRLALLRLLSPPGETLWDRPVHLEAVPGELEVELGPVEPHVELAERLRSDLNEARLRLDRGRLEVVRTRNGLLPRLDLFVSLGKTGFADSFGQAWRDMDGRGYDAVVGVDFEQPLGNRAARAQDTIARVSRQQAAEALANILQLVQFDVRTAYLEVQRSHEQIAATIATRELREETLRAEQEKFRVGTSTALQVAQAQRDLLESQIAEVRALVQHRRSLIDLYRLEGSLLLRRGITAPGDQSEALRAAAER